MPNLTATRFPRATDRLLLKKIRAGDQDAASGFYDRYAQRLLKIIQKNCSADLKPRFDQEDILQSIFRTFFRRASLGQYEVPTGGELWDLLLTIAFNKIRAKGAFHRAAKRDVSKTRLNVSLDQLSEMGCEPGEIEFLLLKMVIDETMEAMPNIHRKMINLRIDGCEVQEIAEKTTFSKRYIERVLQDFRKKLQDVLKNST